jgi:hypothetical protein
VEQEQEWGGIGMAADLFSVFYLVLNGTQFL